MEIRKLSIKLLGKCGLCLWGKWIFWYWMPELDSSSHSRWWGVFLLMRHRQKQWRCCLLEDRSQGKGREQRSHATWVLALKLTSWVNRYSSNLRVLSKCTSKKRSVTHISFHMKIQWGRTKASLPLLLANSDCFLHLILHCTLKKMIG